VLAECSSLPDKINKNLGGITCTIDSGTYNGLDVVSGANNTAVLTLASGSDHLTINETGHLLLGQLVIPIGSVGAYVSIQATAEIKTNASLYVTDGDSDGYPSNLTLTDTATGKRRVGDMISLVALDCDDGNGTKYANAVCYTDTDGDTQYSMTRTSSVCQAGSCPGASANPGTDCNDDSSAVKYADTCYTDADNDTYTNGLSSATCVSHSTCALSTSSSASTDGAAVTGPFTAGLLRDAANGSDCNEVGTNANQVWVAGTCYYDQDNDNYGVAGTYTCMNNATCLSAAWGSIGTGTAYNYNFSNVSTDCCGTDANAYPSSAYCGSAMNACSAWEYDCDATPSEKCDTGTYTCTDPCSGTTTSAIISGSGWDSGVPACGAGGTKNMPDGAPHSGGTCYVGESCAQIDYGSYGATQTCQ